MEIQLNLPDNCNNHHCMTKYLKIWCHHMLLLVLLLVVLVLLLEKLYLKIKWHVENRKTSELKNWEQNPRTITRANFLRLKEKDVSASAGWKKRIRIFRNHSIKFFI